MPWLLIALTVLGVGGLCIAYGVLVERVWFRLNRYRLDILPPGSEPLSLLHVSDLHLLGRQRRKARFLKALPRADVTVATGDLLGDPAAVEPVVAALHGARGTLASFFVLGSNDYFAPKPLNYLHYFGGPSGNGRRSRGHGRARELAARLEADGWTHLKNRRTELVSNGTHVEVLGLDDPHIHRQDSRAIPRRDPSAFGLAVVHSPDPAPELAAFGYDLVLSGHTHGGQVRLPLVGALVTNCSLPRRFARGLTRLGRSVLHVSAGAGTSKYAPFRFLCRPEACLLDLHPSPA